MSDERNILSLFEGLTSDEAQAFRDRIFPALETLRRDVINGSHKPAGHSPKGEKTMDQEFLDSLNEDEQAQLAADIDASQDKIKKQRELAQQAVLRMAFDKEIAGIARTPGIPHETKLRRIVDLKLTYRAKGLQV